MSPVSVCLKCGTFIDAGLWFECPDCGYAPEDDESFTKQLLTKDDTRTPRLEEISRKVKSGEPIEFHKDHVRLNLTSKARMQALIKEGEAMSRNECPKCASPIIYFKEGQSCGFNCTQCNWGIATTNPEAL